MHNIFAATQTGSAPVQAVCADGTNHAYQEQGRQQAFVEATKALLLCNLLDSMHKPSVWPSIAAQVCCSLAQPG